jgi:cyclopropane fatty-acyl-phospholipid synthase-like methyltransferase
MELPYSEACERNREPILAVLLDAFAGCREVLEIGSGTGQHAVYFGRQLPHLRWQTSDLLANLPALAARLAAEGAGRFPPPLALDVHDDPWSTSRVDGIFSANTLHIIARPAVEAFFRGTGQLLVPGGTLVVYGPFRYRGSYTSASNQTFDEWLHQRDPESGIRDFEWVNELASVRGLRLIEDRQMPANNQALVWRRDATAAGISR